MPATKSTTCQCNGLPGTGKRITLHPGERLQIVTRSYIIIATIESFRRVDPTTPRAHCCREAAEEARSLSGGTSTTGTAQEPSASDCCPEPPEEATITIQVATETTYERS